MKRITKQIVSLSLAVLMVFSLFAGCAKSDGSSEPSASASTAPSADGGATTNADREKVTIVFSQPDTGVDNPDKWDSDPILNAIESAVNVDIEYDSGSDGYTDRLQTELIAGTAPDLMCNYGQQELTSEWVNQELVTNIGDIINADPDRYPILYAMINSPEYKMYNEFYTGDPDSTFALYALCAYKSWAGASVYNADLLEAAGLSAAPTTVDEFVAYCNALGGLGKTGWWPRNDELTNLNEIDKTICAPNGTTMMAPTGNAWTGFMPADSSNLEGTWNLMTTSDATKACVEILNGLYESGGLSQDLGVADDFTTAIDNFCAGNIGAINFGFCNYGQYSWALEENWLKANTDGSYEDLVLGQTLEGSAGQGTTYGASYWMGYNWFIPTSCENPDRVLDLLEYIATTEGQDLLFKGIEGTTYTEAADGTLTFNTDEWNNINSVYNLTDDRTQYAWFIYLFAASQQPLDLENSTSWYETSLNPIKQVTTAEVSDAEAYVNSVVSEYAAKAFTEIPAYFTIIQFSDEANAIRTQLSEITLQYIPAFITGQKDIETEWADYVAAYEAAGAATVEQEFNDGIAAAQASYNANVN